MIKFFRRIRQKLLAENKLSKYLIYAIGEIVLVVIGILIALQINNWNIDRISDNQMIAYMRSLKKDLKTDTLNFSKAIDRYKNSIDRRDNLISLSNYDNIPTDSILRLIIPDYAMDRPIKNTFTKITNSGITLISKNDSLSQKIYDYYTTDFEYLDRLLDWEKEKSTFDGEYWIFGQNLFEIKWTDGYAQLQNEDASRENLIRLMSEPKGRNHLNMDYFRKKRVFTNYSRMKKTAVELIAKIEEELKFNL